MAAFWNLLSNAGSLVRFVSSAFALQVDLTLNMPAA